ncbi:hypothetical protein PMI32_00228, partial [Pseudomonas sp. GM60]
MLAMAALWPTIFFQVYISIPA